MRKISWSCVIVGVISIVLSIIGFFIPLDGFVGFNLPFQLLIEFIKSGSLVVPKLSFFTSILQIPFFDYLFSVILVISAIGVTWVKPWGRMLARIYAVSIIFVSIVGAIIIFPGYIVFYNQMVKQGSLGLLPVYAIGGGYFLTFFGTVLYPVILLIFFSRPRVKELFKK